MTFKNFKTFNQYLGDVIKYFTGTNAKDFIQNHIAETAKKRLLETILSNAEIAYQLGFEYPNYFSKFFKKHFGKSPKEYRITRRNGLRN